MTNHLLPGRVLGEGEDNFRAMAGAAPLMIWTADKDKLCTDFNATWLAFTGRLIELELGCGWADGVHPDDIQRCTKTWVEAFEARLPFTIEYRLRRYDGGFHWINDYGTPRFLTDGTFSGYIGYCYDINDRKTVELGRLELAGRLISAQEAERSRIARELHDGIGQEIAVLGIQMQKAFTPYELEAGPEDVMFQNLRNKLAAIGVHVARLSHQLHPSELEYLGLAVAVKKLCREFSEEYLLEVVCVISSVPAGLDGDLALTFLRIVQESLHNVAKHGSAGRLEVNLTGTAEALVLLFRDDGVGFDPHELKPGAGLGLVSMRERIHLLGGKFTIVSAPGAGTAISAQVPLTNGRP
jgi:PAS domain S-box-containing protein